MYKMLAWPVKQELQDALVGHKITGVEAGSSSLYLTLDNGTTLEVEVEAETGILELAITDD